MVACVSGRITSLFPRVKPIADSSIKHLVSCFESEKTERIPLLTQKYCNCSAPIKQNYILLATIWSSPLVTMETARSHPFHTVSKISDPVSVIAPPQQPRVNLAGFAAPSPATENNCQSFSSLASGLWKFYKLMNMSSLHLSETYMHAKAPHNVTGGYLVMNTTFCKSCNCWEDISSSASPRGHSLQQQQ